MRNQQPLIWKSLISETCKMPFPQLQTFSDALLRPRDGSEVFNTWKVQNPRRWSLGTLQGLEGWSQQLQTVAKKAQRCLATTGLLRSHGSCGSCGYSSKGIPDIKYGVGLQQATDEPSDSNICKQNPCSWKEADKGAWHTWKDQCWDWQGAFYLSTAHDILVELRGLSQDQRKWNAQTSFSSIHFFRGEWGGEVKNPAARGENSLSVLNGQISLRRTTECNRKKKKKNKPAGLGLNTGCLLLTVKSWVRPFPSTGLSFFIWKMTRLG